MLMLSTAPLWVLTMAMQESLPVNFLSVANVNNHDLQKMVGNVVNNTVVAYPYAPAFTACQLFAARWPWVFFEQ